MHCTLTHDSHHKNEHSITSLGVPGGPWGFLGVPGGPWGVPGSPCGPWGSWGSLGSLRSGGPCGSLGDPGDPWGSLGVPGGPRGLSKSLGVSGVRGGPLGSLGSLGVPVGPWGSLGIPGSCWDPPGSPWGPWRSLGVAKPIDDCTFDLLGGAKTIRSNTFYKVWCGRKCSRRQRTQGRI